MAYDEDLAKILRDALYGSAGITGKKMFGGLCFFNNDTCCAASIPGAVTVACSALFLIIMKARLLLKVSSNPLSQANP